MKSFLRQIGAWLNQKFNIIASEEESKIYDQIDKELDYNEMMLKYWIALYGEEQGRIAYRYWLEEI